MKKIPISLVVDDPAPFISVYYYHRKPPVTLDGRELVKYVPNEFMERFCKLVERTGIKGKFTIIPAPAYLGDVVRGIEGFPPEETQKWMDMAKKYLDGKFSFGPEILTHVNAMDIETGEDLGEYEWHWSQRQTRQTLTPYISKSLEILKEAGVDSTGIVCPVDFGIQVLDEFEDSAMTSMKNVYSKDQSWYFLHLIYDTPNVKPWVALEKDGKKLVAIPGNVDDFFWQTIHNSDTSEEFIESVASTFISPDGKSGKIIDAINNGCHPVFLSHWQSLYSNGLETGFKALERVVERINTFLSDKCYWASFEEITNECIKNNYTKDF